MSSTVEKTQKVKRKGPIPIQLLKAFIDALILFCIPGLIITFGVPSYTIELTRVNRERVDATVSKNILFIVPTFTYTATDLIGTESDVMDGGVIREHGKIVGEAEDEGLLLLKGQIDEPIEVYISPRDIYDVKDEIQYFITESKEPSLRMWVVSNWKFGVILPGGILLFCLAAFFVAAWYIITGKPFK